MADLRPLRPLSRDDLVQVIEVYRDAVLGQAPALYSPDQVVAWADQAGQTDLSGQLEAGNGLASCSADGATIEAFALLHPRDRLSLLYCRGRSSRQGRASALLEELECRSSQLGIGRLRTEASYLSRPLLERRGWRVEDREDLLIAGVPFSRFRMAKDLTGSSESPA
jgi:putative acetyltransferase